MKQALNQSGVVLISILWILTILSFMAVSISRSAHIELDITQNAMKMLKSRYVAFGGVQYAMEQMEIDNKDEETNKMDNLYYCGISKMALTPHELFKEKKMNQGVFNIMYEQDENIIYGMQDEERKININALRLNNINILSTLIMLKGFDEEQANMIAYSVMDWKDPDKARHHIEYGAENRYYESLDKPYLPKNLPFESLEELLLVREMNEEIFKAIKENITIYPSRGLLKINFDTANKDTLQALALSFSGNITNTTEDDASSLVDKMLSYRRGSDGVDGTIDDRSIDSNGMGLNPKELVIFTALNTYRTLKSNYFRILVRGVEGSNQGSSTIEAVVHQKNMDIMAWHRN